MHKEPIQFQVDDDTFDGVTSLPAMSLMDVAIKHAGLSQNLADPATVRAVEELFEILLTTDSAKRFIERLRDPDRPIGVEQMNDITGWLMEQHGMRPTVPSSPSSDGSPQPLDGGISSTVSVPTGALTSMPSASTGS